MDRQEVSINPHFKAIPLFTVILFLFSFCFQELSEAGRLDLEKDLQKHLKQSRKTAKKAKEKQIEETE
jgi:hypothetical protein